MERVRRLRLHDEPGRRRRLSREHGFRARGSRLDERVPALGRGRLGSILLLLRSRHAATAFLVSLAGALVSFVYQFTSDKPESLESGLPVIMPVAIMILILAQWYYARRQAAAGVLR